jgi:hypothetical protein
VVATITPNPVYQTRGGWYLTMRLAETAGVGTTLSSFAINGQNSSQLIPSLFGTSKIPASGALSSNVALNGVSVPAALAFSFGGVDANGHSWSQSVSVQLLGAQTSRVRN